MQRVVVITNEIAKFIPITFNIYEELKPKQFTSKYFGTFENFAVLNSHVVFPKKLNRHFQKRILRLLYLYGIPKNEGFEKIENLLGYKLSNYKSILIFLKKILFRCLKYQPNLSQLLKTLPRIDEKLMTDPDYCEMKWIKEEAIKSVSEQIYLIYQVCEYFFVFHEMIEAVKSKMIDFPEWSEVKDKYSWWSIDCDIVLFNITAYYGFLFNSVFANFLKNCSIDEQSIKLLREQELLFLTPISKDPKINYLGPILNFELKKKRIIELLACLKEFSERKRNSNA